MNYTEDTLVQQTTANYLEQQFGWQSVYAYNNNEDFGPNSLLGLVSDCEGVLARSLHDIIQPHLRTYTPSGVKTLSTFAFANAPVG